MLKRSRAPSPSPTRADPSSPPPLDNHPRLPLPKRRRTVGPVIDSNERRDCTTMDDGEDDYESDDECGDTDVPAPDGKVYEHVNCILHSLHAEHQHRSRTAQPHSSSAFHSTHSGSQATGASTFLSPRDSPPPWSSPLSSPAKYVRESQACQSSLSSIPHDEHVETRECEESVKENPEGVHGNTTLATSDKAKHCKTDVQDGERISVMQRYEDTNRLLGSLVLSRRRTLRSPSVDSE